MARRETKIIAEKTIVIIQTVNAQNSTCYCYRDINVVYRPVAEQFERPSTVRKTDGSRRTLVPKSACLLSSYVVANMSQVVALGRQRQP